MAEAKSSLRTPLGRVRFLGSARLGSQENWLMHATSVALLPLAIGFVWLVLSLLRHDYNGVRSELQQPIPAILLLLFVIVGVYHMQTGMRSIIVDYVHGHARAWALIGNACAAGLLATACVYATLRIGFL